VFVDGRPTEWRLVSEMRTRRECAAVAFSLTRLIMAPPPGGRRDGTDSSSDDEAEKSNPMYDGDADELEVEGVE
jgi:hypothetical protein